MRIFLTGATGFLGSRLATALFSRNHDIVIVKRSSSDTTRIGDISNRVAFVDLDRGPIAETIEKHLPADLVLHAATCYGRNGESADEILQANTLFPLQLLEAATKAGIPTFINIGTGLDRRLNPYSLSKGQFSEWGRLLAENSDMRFVDIATEHFYGPGADQGNFITYLVTSCLLNVAEIPLTPGEQTRDFLYIDDAVAGIVLLIENLSAVAGNPLSIDLGSGETTTIRKLAETTCSVTRSVTQPRFGAIPYRPGEPMTSRADATVLRRMGWAPRVPFEEGLARTIEYERNRLGKTRRGRVIE